MYVETLVYFIVIKTLIVNETCFGRYQSLYIIIMMLTYGYDGYVHHTTWPSFRLVRIEIIRQCPGHPATRPYIFINLSSTRSKFEIFVLFPGCSLHLYFQCYLYKCNRSWNVQRSMQTQQFVYIISCRNRLRIL